MNILKIISEKYNFSYKLEGDFYNFYDNENKVKIRIPKEFKDDKDFLELVDWEMDLQKDGL